MMLVLRSSTAKSSMRPPITAGPISRNFSALKVSLMSAAIAVVAMRNASAIFFIESQTLLNPRGARQETLYDFEMRLEDFTTESTEYTEDRKSTRLTSSH